MIFLKRIVVFIIVLIFSLISCNNQDNPKKNVNNTKKTIKKTKKEEQLLKEPDYKTLKDTIKKLQYNKSIPIIKKLLVNYPKSAELYYLLGVVTKNSNPDPLEAIKILHLSTSLNDKHGKSWKLLGDLYYIRGDFKKAIKAWELTLETIKDDSNLYYKLAYVYYTQKDNDLAIKYFLKSLKINNKLEWSYYYLSEIYFEKMRNVKKAIAFIKKGINLLPKSKNLNQKLAIYYYDSGQYEESIKWNKEVLKIVKYDNFAIENISDAYMKLKKYDEAIVWLDKIVKEQPKSVYYIKKIARIYKDSNKLKKAIELLSYATNLKEDPDLELEVAKLYLILGDKKKYNEIIDELKLSKNPKAIRITEYLKMENINIKGKDDSNATSLDKKIESKDNNKVKDNK